MDERRRPYNSHKGDYHEVTEEEMEAYHMKRRQEDDPMKDFLQSCHVTATNEITDMEE